MGIEGLLPFLKEHDLIDIVSLPGLYRHQVVPCDIASTLFKYRTTSATDDEFMIKVRAFVVSFLLAEVHVVFIFDGKAPPDKDEEHRERAEQRDKAANRLDQLHTMLNNLSLTDEQLRTGVVELGLRIMEIEDLEMNVKFEQQQLETSFVNPPAPSSNESECTLTEPSLLNTVSARMPEGTTESPLRTTLRKVYDKRITRNVKLEARHFQMVQNYMTEYGVPWIQAPGEAEAFACYLIEHHAHWFAPAILTEDSDSLTYGAPYWLSQYTPKDWTCRSINLMRVMDTLKFTCFEQFRDFCILCECDYNHRLPGYGPTKLYKQWIEAGITLEQFLTTVVSETVTGEHMAAVRTERCRTLFEHFGQDTEQQREDVLGRAFQEWLAARPTHDPYWILDKEAELAQVSYRSQTDVWRIEGASPENTRVLANWAWPKSSVDV